MMRFVKNYIINEKFTDESDPIRDMGIGNRAIIEKWIKQFSVGRYHDPFVLEAKFTINNNLTIDVKGNLNLYNIGLVELPLYIKFRTVKGTMWINSNPLTTLRGCPEYVTDNFFCCDNQLTSLEYAPKKVDDMFACYNNLVEFTIEDVKKVCNVKGNDIRVKDPKQ